MLIKEEKEKIEEKFNIIIEQLGEQGNQIVKNLESLHDKEQIAIKYLYAYMPFSDIADYHSELFLKFVRHSLKVKECMPWGKIIDTNTFFNYVLQYRINNENIEFFSKQFFDELEKRVEGLSMYKAAVEVNYWCLEKATYQSTNSRTASPLTICKSTYGRCGEESTLAVAALRSVGIPARQCYTPRWAHCEDNHAWVEVWIDGVWHFMGACEPEIELDRGWFQFPASKAMLIHHRIFSDLVKEEVITKSNGRITEINLLHHYAQTREVKVKVIDKIGNPVEGVFVSFEIVNDSEFYSLATIQTNKEGMVSFVTGLGDLVIFAYHKKVYTYQKLEVRKNDFLLLQLPDIFLEETTEITFNLVPPKGEIKEKFLTEEQKNLDKQKKQKAIEKRKNYEDTFFTKETANTYIKQCLTTQIQKENIDRETIIRCLIDARGNSKEIQQFLEDKETQLFFLYKILLLKSLSRKDLIDSKAKILKEHLLYAMPFREQYKEEIFVDYLLCPRIWLEMITSYRKQLIGYFTEEEKKNFMEDKRQIYQYLFEQIELYDDSGYSNLITSPIGVLKLKRSNILSVKILCVAILRTLGIPAKIEKSDESILYYENKKWNSLKREEKKSTATLILKKSTEDTFMYYKNYTIGYLKEARYCSLNLEDILWEDNIIKYSLETGHYRIITANRQPDGTNLIKVQFISLDQNETKEVTLELLKERQRIKEVKLSNRNFSEINGEKKRLSEWLDKDYNILAWLQVGEEPTEHLLNEWIELKEKYQTRNIILILKEEQDLQNTTLQKVLSLLPHIKVGIEIELFELDEIYKAFEIIDKRMPFITLIDDKRTVFYAWAGYNVGIGEILLRESEGNSF